MQTAFTTSQRKTIWGCLVLYTLAYLNRMNLAPALDSLIQAFQLTPSQAGWLPTAFAVTYAIGQMVNGALIDRLDPLRHMLISSIGSALCNLLIGRAEQFGSLLFICVLNGAFQSMMWTPIVQMIALYFEPHKQKKANMMASLTLIVGHLGAWALSGFLCRILTWRACFIVPGILTFPVLIAVFCVFRGVTHGRSSKSIRRTKHGHRDGPTLFSIFTRSGFSLIILASLSFGFVRDGIMNWAPSLLDMMAPGKGTDSVLLSLIIPVIDAFGMLVSYILQVRSQIRNRQLSGSFLLLSGVFCLLLMMVHNLASVALLMGLACACYSGIAPVINTLIPLEYEPEKVVGLTAGIIDSSIYLGSALTGVCSGFVYEMFGMRSLFLSWACIAVLGGIIMHVSDFSLRKWRTAGQKLETRAMGYQER